MTTANDILERVGEVYGTRGVYGEPVDRDGVTIVPAARVSGGGGGGGGVAPDDEARNGQSEGSGMGFGLRARPAGAWVIKEGDATWKPAFDLGRVLMAASLAFVAYFVFGRWLPSRHVGR